MSKTLIIAEKPSVASDIAMALGGFSRKDEWFEREDLIVSSAVGHLVELACPKAEDPGNDLARLPAIPNRFELSPIEKTASRLALLRKLMNRQDIHTVVNACDAGREGELIFRYIYLAAGCRKPMQRMWIRSMTTQAIKEAYTKRAPGHERDNLFNAAQSRAEADWLLGINGTRAMSILTSRQTGKRTRSSVGRVQTPTLAIVVEREEAIRNFVAKPYFEIHADFAAAAGTYAAKWANPNFQADPHNPDARAERLFDKDRADAIAGKCAGQAPSSVEDIATDVVSHPPKLFDLTTLQREANQKFGLTAAQTLALAKALYEKHKVLTYPRTDASALPEDYVDKARDILTRLGETHLPMASFATTAAGLVKPDKRIFNNTKISDHFAIIPTGLVSSALGSEEAKIFDLVTRRFIAVFFPPALYLQTVRKTVVAQEIFRSSGRVLITEGWLAVYGHEAKDKDEPALAAVAAGELPDTVRIEVVALKTKEPARFSEAALLAAMESAGAVIEDDELREAMKERGLGTPATRAATIEGLLTTKNGKGDPIEPYLVRDKKILVPTPKAFDLITFFRTNDLDVLVSPVMTGQWEFKLREMEQGRFNRRTFMDEIASLARGVVDRVRNAAKDLPELPNLGTKHPMAATCPNCRKTLTMNAKTFSCECGFTVWREIAGRVLTQQEGEQLIAQGALPSLSGFVSMKKKPFSAGLKLAADGKVEFVFDEASPGPASDGAAAVECPQCGKPMRRRKGTQGFFWGCTGYPECKNTMDDADGKPVARHAKPAGTAKAGQVGESCPTCKKGKLTGRQSQAGAAFIGCTRYPECRHYQRV